jgi:hypothetical protein
MKLPKLLTRLCQTIIRLHHWSIAMSKQALAIIIAAVLALAPIQATQAAVPLIAPIVSWIVKSLASKGAAKIAAKSAVSLASKAGASASKAAAASRVAASAAKGAVGGTAKGAAMATGKGAVAIEATRQSTASIDWKSLALKAATAATLVSGVKDAYATINDLGLEELPEAPIGPDLDAAAKAQAEFPIRACVNPANGKLFVVSPTWIICPDRTAPKELTQIQFSS